MLVELWEKLRGYDKWIETQATIKSSNLSEERIGAEYHRYTENEPIYEWESSNALTWKDDAGKEHCAEYKVSENSPLFQIYDGQTVKIRYNPADPGQFYLRGVQSSLAGTTFRGKIFPFLANIMSRR